MYKNIKQDWTQHISLVNPTSDWPPTGCNSFHHYSLGPSIQAVSNTENNTPVQDMVCQLLQKNAVGDSVKDYAEFQVEEDSKINGFWLSSGYYT